MSKPVINKEKCTNCGMCILVCPQNVFGKENGSVVVKKPDECIDCGACEMQCPEQAIKLE